MAKKQPTATESKPASEEQKDGELEAVMAMAQLITKRKSMTSVGVYSSMLMDAAEVITGVTGSQLLERTLDIKKHKKTLNDEGEEVLVSYKVHLSTYANTVRDMVKAHVQRKYVPVVHNLTRMAVSYLCKDPITREGAEDFAANYADSLGTALANTLANYMSRLRNFGESYDLIMEQDLMSIADVFVNSYKEWLNANWDSIAPKNEE